VLDLIHRGLRSRFGKDTCTFLNLFQILVGAIISVVDNMAIDSGTAMMISLILRSASSIF
jgi:hypothetical protein